MTAIQLAERGDLIESLPKKDGNREGDQEGREHLSESGRGMTRGAVNLLEEGPLSFPSNDND